MSHRFFRVNDITSELQIYDQNVELRLIFSLSQISQKIEIWTVFVSGF